MKTNNENKELNKDSNKDLNKDLNKGSNEDLNKESNKDVTKKTNKESNGKKFKKSRFQRKNRQKNSYIIILIMNYRLFLLLIIKENGIGLKNWEICLPLYIRKKKVLLRDCHLLQEQW